MRPPRQSLKVKPLTIFRFSNALIAQFFRFSREDKPQIMMLSLTSGQCPSSLLLLQSDRCGGKHNNKESFHRAPFSCFPGFLIRFEQKKALRVSAGRFCVAQRMR
jgi:hypothetical protein